MGWSSEEAGSENNTATYSTTLLCVFRVVTLRHDPTPLAKSDREKRGIFIIFFLVRSSLTMPILTQGSGLAAAGGRKIPDLDAILII